MNHHSNSPLSVKMPERIGHNSESIVPVPDRRQTGLEGSGL